ncbi:hypothetical protein GUJ93_ZPchr0002g23833 [Zizania palustris]|uniref:Uncharacterized protein n=1 Tax=Zizania palustris TaxID=103762 RepID=A0A8J5SSX4_ZIZPA|nr:hypothetical protein GUJ93_ZPchr0002g23833 [Zizania palustris]
MTPIVMAPGRKVVQPPRKEVALKNKSSAHRPRQDLTGDGLALHDDIINMTTKGDSIPRPDDDNHMDTEAQ